MIIVFKNRAEAFSSWKGLDISCDGVEGKRVILKTRAKQIMMNMHISE